MIHDDLLARTCAERNELDAEVQLLRLQNLTLSAKLEEAQAEIVRQAECERAMIGAVHSWSQRAEAAEGKLSRFKASPGKIITACPRCHTHDPHERKTGGFYCPPCGHEFTEPVYYQKVSKP